jgi:hypothetical protein
MTNPYIEALASLHAAMGNIISMLRDNSSLADRVCASGRRTLL